MTAAGAKKKLIAVFVMPGKFLRCSSLRASLDIDRGDVRLRFFGKDGKSRLGVGSVLNDEAMLVFHKHDHSLSGVIRPNGKGKLVASDDRGIETLLTAKH